MNKWILFIKATFESLIAKVLIDDISQHWQAFCGKRMSMINVVFICSIHDRL